jgi:hypothetical protein
MVPKGTPRYSTPDQFFYQTLYCDDYNQRQNGVKDNSDVMNRLNAERGGALFPDIDAALRPECCEGRTSTLQ